ncbi:ATP-binding protein [Parafrankia sp. BMG5.11]|uniref:ATP-binding protein n=1 Tax=Parafrankia sp. BMG5.11 TaxID=222540 RepID=UPI001040AEF3|nr:ATP-binding protein [Parafrankia sp. BMG5.11]TCJ33730.1 ATP-binding protein [Parafrankia sp. BMG5.11]
MTDLVAQQDLVAIADVWRFPELAVRERSSEPIEPRQRARLLARGIADRCQPADAVGRLIDDGEYDAAEDILDQVAGLLQESSTKGLARRMAAERAAVVDDLTMRARVFRDRADRIGGITVDVALIGRRARSRRGDGEALLATLAKQVDAAEQVEIDRIHRRRRDTLGDQPTDAARVWADQVAALLEVREIRAARQVLEDGPGASALLPVEEPTAAWPWRAVPMEEILRWFDSSLLAPPGLREYVVDEAGQTLVGAMRAVANEPADQAHALLASAIQQLIGVEGVPPRLTPVDDGDHLTTLLVPDEFRLPPLSFVGRGEGLRVRIGDAPSVDPPAAVWLVPRIREERRRRMIVVTLADLLSLLQSEKTRSGRPRTATSRRMGLIRTICQQRAVKDVVTADAFVETPGTHLRNQVWWLLHVFGVTPDGVSVDTVLYESGAHPVPLVKTLHHLVEQARSRGQARLEPATFVELRASTPYQDDLRAGLLAELGDAAAAGLFAAVFFASADDLRSALDTIAADAELTVPIERLIDIGEVTARLRETGHLVADNSGCLALCDCGITHLLRLGNPHEVAKEALRRLARDLDDRTPDDPGDPAAQLQEAQFQQRLAEIRLHDERERADRAEAALELAQGAAALIRGDRQRREDRRRVDAWRSERVEIDLQHACREVAATFARYGDQVDIIVIPGEPVTVVGSSMALDIALRNIIGNAERAARDHRPPGEGTVSVRISLASDGQRQAIVDVLDNGPGFPEAVLARTARGQAPPSGHHDGDGEGIMGAKVLLALLDGDLEVLPTAAPELGGGHVRLRLALPAAR